MRGLILVLLALAASPLHAETLKKVTVAGGCFWCVESDFEHIDGVIEAVSGYTGGTTKNPTYKEVSYSNTGHYEAVEITYDADKLSERAIYDLYFRSIDALDAGGQFCDRGHSYKTAIFVTDAQKANAEAAKQNAAQILGAEIATKILPLAPFYKAEEYHQDYYKKNPLKYTYYRTSCGRNSRVKQLWKDQAIYNKFSD